MPPVSPEAILQGQEQRYLAFLDAEFDASARLQAFFREATAELAEFVNLGDLTAADETFFGHLLDRVRSTQMQMIDGGQGWLDATLPHAYVDGATTSAPGMSFGLVHDQAVRALSGNALGLITETALSVRLSIQQQIAQGILQGLSGRDLRARLLDTGLTNIDRWPSVEYRAGVIARTETMRAYNAGNLAGIIESGGRFVRWITSPDEAVCRICRPRDNHVYRLPGVPMGDMNDPWGPAIRDLPGPPPAHPRCRCTIRAEFRGPSGQVIGGPPPMPEGPTVDPMGRPAVGDVDEALRLLGKQRAAWQNGATIDPAQREWWRSIELDDEWRTKLAALDPSDFTFASILRYGITPHFAKRRAWTDAMRRSLLDALEAVRALVPRYAVDSATLTDVGLTHPTPWGNAIARADRYFIKGIEMNEASWEAYVNGRALRAGGNVNGGLEVVVHEIGHTVHYRYGLHGSPTEFVAQLEGTGLTAGVDAYALGASFQSDWHAVRLKSRGMGVAPTEPVDAAVAIKQAEARVAQYEREYTGPLSYAADYARKALVSVRRAYDKIAKGTADFYPTEYAKSGGDAEDFAESFMLYVLRPEKLKLQAPNRYRFMRERVFGGKGG